MYAILPDDRADLFPCAFLLVDVRIIHGGRGACGCRREEKFGKNRS